MADRIMGNLDSSLIAEQEPDADDSMNADFPENSDQPNAPSGSPAGGVEGLFGELSHSGARRRSISLNSALPKQK